MSPGRPAAVVAALLLAASAAPGASSSGAAPGPAPSSPGTGVLRGRLLVVGGPAPGAARPVPGSVTVVGAAARHDLDVSADGSYAVRLVPGRYTLGGRSPGYLDGAGGCSSLDAVTVVVGRTVVADTVCPMR